MRAAQRSRTITINIVCPLPRVLLTTEIINCHGSFETISSKRFIPLSYALSTADSLELSQRFYGYYSKTNIITTRTCSNSSFFIYTDIGLLRLPQIRNWQLFLNFHSVISEMEELYSVQLALTQVYEEHSSLKHPNFKRPSIISKKTFQTTEMLYKILLQVTEILRHRY